MAKSLQYIGKFEGDFINNTICIYKRIGESFILLYNVVKSWQIFHFIIKKCKNWQIFQWFIKYYKNIGTTTLFK